MSEHTKGPWRVEEGTTVIWGACDPDDTSTYGMGYPVADGRTMFGYIPSLRTHRVGEAEANARLIAAAPDLLEALKDLSAELGSTGIFVDWPDLKAQVDAALAKAGAV